MILQNRVMFENKVGQEQRGLPEMPELPRLAARPAPEEEDDSWLNDGPRARPQPTMTRPPQQAATETLEDDATIRLSRLETSEGRGDPGRAMGDTGRARAIEGRARASLATTLTSTVKKSEGSGEACPRPTIAAHADRAMGDEGRGDARPRPPLAASPISGSDEYIGVGNALWPLVLRLSERIWHELYQRPDITSTPDLLLVELVRKRAIDLLKAEPKSASEIHDLSEAERLLHSVVNETLGYGPLETWMKDEHVFEITVIGPRFAYVERDGVVEDVPCRFEDDRHMQRVIENMLRRGGRRLTPGWPIIDARLPDGSLLNVVMPPASVNGPVLTIHKRARKPLALADMAELGSLSQQMADYLQARVRARRNIVICGDVASGRTTLLNALCEAIPEQERIATIEEAAELQLSQKHVVSLVSQATGGDSAGSVTMRDLVRHALRTGSERVVLGECRGDETRELIQAMYSGYTGVLMCVYSASLKDCLAHLETLCLAAGSSMPAELIRAQLGATIDVIVLVSRLRDGSRKVVNIAEVQGFEANAIKLQSIYYYRQTAPDTASGHVQGEFAASGFPPAALKSRA